MTVDDRSRADGIGRPNRSTAQAPPRISASTTWSVGNGVSSLASQNHGASASPWNAMYPIDAPAMTGAGLMPRTKATNGSKRPAVMMIATAPYGQPNENALVPSESRENIDTVAHTVATRIIAAPMRSVVDALARLRRPPPALATTSGTGAGAGSSAAGVSTARCSGGSVVTAVSTSSWAVSAG